MFGKGLVYLFSATLVWMMPALSNVRLIYAEKSAFQIQNDIFFKSDLGQIKKVLNALGCLVPHSLLLKATNFDEKMTDSNINAIIKIKKLVYASLKETPFNKTINIDEEKIKQCNLDFSSELMNELRELYIYEINLQKKYGTWDKHDHKRNEKILSKFNQYVEMIDQKIPHYVFLQD